MLTIFLLLCLLARGDSLVPGLGGCANLRGVANFDKSRYLGVWYEYTNVFEIFQLKQKCTRATYTDEGATVGVTNDAISTLTGDPAGIKGRASIPNPSEGRGELSVGFGGFGGDGSDANYIIVDTDYDNYSIVWSCKNKLIIKIESLWLLTRKRFPEKALVEHASRRMRQLGGLPTKWLSKTDQTGCQRLPPPPPPYGSGQAPPRGLTSFIG